MYGEVIDAFSAKSDEVVLQIELFDDEIERLLLFDPLTGYSYKEMLHLYHLSKNHYIISREQLV